MTDDIAAVAAKLTEARLPVKIYDQDGNFVHLSVPNNRSGELFAEWLRVHDRYTSAHLQAKDTNHDA